LNFIKIRPISLIFFVYSRYYHDLGAAQLELIGNYSVAQETVLFWFACSLKKKSPHTIRPLELICFY